MPTRVVVYLRRTVCPPTRATVACGRSSSRWRCAVATPGPGHPRAVVRTWPPCGRTLNPPPRPIRINVSTQPCQHAQLRHGRCPPRLGVSCRRGCLWRWPPRQWATDSSHRADRCGGAVRGCFSPAVSRQLPFVCRRTAVVLSFPRPHHDTMSGHVSDAQDWSAVDKVMRCLLVSSRCRCRVQAAFFPK